MAHPGAWFDGATRVAIAAETRHARQCELCRHRKAALSPYGIEGRHDSTGLLPERMVEQIHRIATDSGRLTRSWFDRVLASGTSDTEYVEIVGVVVTTIAVDIFCRGLGLPSHPLPEPAAGAPHRRRPRTAHQRGEAWVPLIQSQGPRGSAGIGGGARPRALLGRDARQYPACAVARARGGLCVVHAGGSALPSRQMDAGFRAGVSRHHPCADRTDRGACLGPEPVFLLNHLTC
jgi:hypothetical protein